MSALQSWRKAYGALKDSTTVSLANLNSDFKVCTVESSSPLPLDALGSMPALHWGFIASLGSVIPFCRIWMWRS
jgi:hypothetical protein